VSQGEPAKVVFEDLLPGETSIDDVSELKVAGITTRKQLAVVEARNIKKAVVKYFKERPTLEIASFELDWAHQLHDEMYSDVWGWAGKPRLKNFNLGIPFYQINESLTNLLADLKFWKDSGMDLVEQAATLHHRAAYIHPYVNGNGRWSRMLSNIWLGVQGSPIVIWPETVIGDVSPLRDEYIVALKKADAGDPGQFIEMHRRHLDTDSE
jgi:fido (protein-threonine AMPylation protein)